MFKCGHKHTVEKNDIQLGRKVIITKCKRCLEVVEITDNGPYNGTPRPIPNTIKV